MTHYIRDENRTIIECETINKIGKTIDLSSSIDVAEYSDLLYYNMERFNEIKWDFAGLLNDIRADWFEYEHEISIDDFVKDRYSRIAKKYNLNYVTD